MLGLVIALLVVLLARNPGGELTRSTFQTLVLISLAPAAIAVLSLAIGARESIRGAACACGGDLQGPGQALSGVHADRGPVRRRQLLGCLSGAARRERGLELPGILGMLITFNLIYTLVSAPAGASPDRWGAASADRRGLAGVCGDLSALLAGAGWRVGALWPLWHLLWAGLWHGQGHGGRPGAGGVARHRLWHLRFVLGLLDLPASLIAGLLWQGAGRWSGFGAARHSTLAPRPRCWPVCC